MALEIVTIPCLSDNYAYLARDADTGIVALIDAPEVAPIKAALAARGWTLNIILLTHHHDDHIQGVEDLRKAFDCTVIGGKADVHRLPPLDQEVSEGDTVAIGGSTGHVLDVSGHTVGHIAFHFPDSAAVFSADSLMGLGCGRLFEGDGPMMWTSMLKFKAMPPETIVYSGHEYSTANAAFAVTIESDNAALQDRVADITAKRADGTPTIPTPLSLELATNPFLRADDPAVKAAVGMPDASDAEVFTEVRKRKDQF